MDYLSTNLNWQEHFIYEYEELQEKLPSFDVDALSKSKIRLSLENNILDWEKYEAWALENLGCSCLKPGIKESILKNFLVNAKLAYESYSKYKIWNEDLLPIFTWDNQLVVFGLEYNEKLLAIENHIFILAPPRVLNYFAEIMLQHESSEERIEQVVNKLNVDLFGIEGLQSFEIKPPTLDFKSIHDEAKNKALAQSAPIAEPVVEKIDDSDVWDFINERHQEYSYEAKQYFSAYLVLKIETNKTRVFKMDPDLEKKQINPKLFEFNVTEQNPFKKVYENGSSESFNISQLGLEFLNFKYVCITALKRSDRVVGFLVGLKEKTLCENDQLLLKVLAKESVS